MCMHVRAASSFCESDVSHNASYNAAPRNTVVVVCLRGVRIAATLIISFFSYIVSPVFFCLCGAT